MHISYLTQPGSGQVNEDYACAGPHWAIVLDGATAPPGADSGCIHDVPWLVRHLAAALAGRLILGHEDSLADILAEAIKQTCDAHAATCDLANPDSPSTTVTMFRAGGGRVDCLTLGDSPTVLWYRDGSFSLVEDDRTDYLPGGRPYSTELVRRCRNREGGFWVASTNPDAAYHAITGTADLADVAAVGMFTDGITRLIAWYRYTWPMIYTKLRAGGPPELITTLRRAEQVHPYPWAKQHDDATALFAQTG